MASKKEKNGDAEDVKKHGETDQPPADPGAIGDGAPPEKQPESGEAMPHTPPTAETKEPEKPAEGVQEDPPAHSAPHKTSQHHPPRPKCPICGSEAVGVAGGLRRCNQCGQTWH